MIDWIALTVVSVVLAVVAGWAVPAWVAKRLVAAQQAGGAGVANFRGRKVALGLGLVWLVWVVGIAGLSNLIGFASQLVTGSIQGAGLVPQDWWNVVAFAPFPTVSHAIPIILVIGAVAFGLADDALGGGSDKGCRGHLAALREGRLTTGMLKLLGIGLLSFVTATSIASTMDNSDPWVAATTGWTHGALLALGWLAATLVIALAANLVNLTDLRPGRALKTYSVLAVIGTGLCMWGFWKAPSSWHSAPTSTRRQLRVCPPARSSCGSGASDRRCACSSWFSVRSRRCGATISGSTRCWATPVRTPWAGLRATCSRGVRRSGCSAYLRCCWSR